MSDIENYNLKWENYKKRITLELGTILYYRVAKKGFNTVLTSFKT